MVRVKKSGNVSYELVTLIFFILIISITSLKLEERKIQFVKYSYENAAILSVMAANVPDRYEFATQNEMLYQTNAAITYGNNLADIDVAPATKAAWIIAQNRFKTALNTNFPANIKNVKSYTIDEFAIYNVVKQDNKVYWFNGTTSMAEVKGIPGTVTTSSGDIVANSGIYVSMTVVFKSMGQEYRMNIHNFVGLQPS